MQGRFGDLNFPRGATGLREFEFKADCGWTVKVKARNMGLGMAAAREALDKRAVGAGKKPPPSWGLQLVKQTKLNRGEAR
jgi:hypothetical protein